MFREPGAEIIAEDLGIVPDFVRESLARLGVPGYKVFRWERDWHEPGQPFRDPADYPAASVATSGTHDTEPMAIWWEEAPARGARGGAGDPVDARALTGGRPALARRRARHPCARRCSRRGSDLLILPIQDVFGWRDRINQPATVGDDNWTWRLPWPSDRCSTEPGVRCRRAVAPLVGRERPRLTSA